MIVTITVIIAIALVGLTMLQVDPVAADRTVTTGSAITDEALGFSDPNVGAAIGKMVSALLIVVVLVYGALWLLKRMMGRRYTGKGGSGGLEVLQSTHVGPHKQISLVRVGKRSVLVGVTDNQISTLTELSPEETKDIIETVAETNPSASFSHMLSSATGKLKAIGLGKNPTALET